MKIGIIGVGFVGGAVMEACLNAGLSVRAFDKYKKIGSIESVCESDVIFVAVPTPSIDGMQDLSAVRDVLTSLEVQKFGGPVVIKSTVLPGTCDLMTTVYPSLTLIHNPEFLTERNAKQDFLNQKHIPISGTNFEAIETVAEVFGQMLPEAVCVVYSDYKATELGKYIHNCFLATKVAFMNEMYFYCKEINTDYDDAISVAIGQGVIGSSHTRVPGPDGQLGFGGSCFPKDTEALLNSNHTVPKTLSILTSAVRFNKTIRR